MEKVLVTGASGFIGYHLVKALIERGNEVTCLVRESSNLSRIEPLGVKLAHGDVTDPASLAPAVHGKDVVYHLAGVVIAFNSAQLHRVNEEGVRNMAAACAGVPNPPVLLLVSSVAAAGPAVKGRLRTEEDPPEPVSNYGRSKRAGELAAEEFADRVPITIVRPPIVFGEADVGCLDIFRPIKRFHLHFVPSFTRREFSFLHAADLAQMLILAAEQGRRVSPPQDNLPSTAGYYFADSGEHPTYHELGRMIGKAFGYRHTFSVSCFPIAVWAVSALSDLGGRIRGKPNFLSIDKAREATAGGWACSGKKAADELGFSVAKPLLERFRQTVQWYRNENWL